MFCRGISHFCEDGPVYSEFSEVMESSPNWVEYALQSVVVCDYGEHNAYSIDTQLFVYCTVQHMQTVPCDFLARECLCINLCRGNRYAHFEKRAFPTSQVVSCSQRHVESLSFGRYIYIYIYMKLTLSHVTIELQSKRAWTLRNKWLCSLGNSIESMWLSPFLRLWLVTGPEIYVLVYIYIPACRLF